MSQLTQITGMKQIVDKLKSVSKNLNRDLARGFRKGGIFLQRKSQETVPVQLGNLKNSAFTRDIGLLRPDVIVGYTAEYAVWVHEDLERATHGTKFNIKHAEDISAAKGTPRGTAKGGMFSRGKNQQAKFLERPAREHRDKILQIVYFEAKFK